MERAEEDTQHSQVLKGKIKIPHSNNVQAPSSIFLPSQISQLRQKLKKHYINDSVDIHSLSPMRCLNKEINPSDYLFHKKSSSKYSQANSSNSNSKILDKQIPFEAYVCKLQETKLAKNQAHLQNAQLNRRNNLRIIPLSENWMNYKNKSQLFDTPDSKEILKLKKICQLQQQNCIGNKYQDYIERLKVEQEKEKIEQLRSIEPHSIKFPFLTSLTTKTPRRKLNNRNKSRVIVEKFQSEGYDSFLAEHSSISGCQSESIHGSRKPIRASRIGQFSKHQICQNINEINEVPFDQLRSDSVF